MDRSARDWQGNQPRIVSAVNILLGLWLVAAPFVMGFDDQTEATINVIVVGLIVAGLALLKFLRPHDMVWPGWLNVVLGFWLIGSPWFVGDGDGPLVANNWIVGFAIVVLAIWSGITALEPAQTEGGHHEMA